MKRSARKDRSRRAAMAMTVYAAAVALFFIVRYSAAYPHNRWIVAVPAVVASAFTLLHCRRGGIFIPLALVASAAGDFMGARHIFIAQVAYFALAHIFYILDFRRRLNFSGRLPAVAALAAAAAVFLVLVLRCVESVAEFAAIAVYGAVIFAMAACAVAQERERRGWYAAAALLFVVSDAMIVWNKYVAPVPFEDELVMATYYAAQGIFACLMLRRDNSRD